MKILHTLFCLFFLSLQDGNTVSAQHTVYAGVEGGNVTVQCSLSSSGTRMFFCKEKCEEENVLIGTRDARDQRGRYNIRYVRGDIFVTITQLNKSDSGLYMCGLDNMFSTSYQQIEIVVVDALLDGKHDSSEEKPLYSRTGRNITVLCRFTNSGRSKSFCKDKCEEKDILVQADGFTAQRGRYSISYLEGIHTGGFVYVTITQLMRSDSGRYRCGLDTSSQGFQIIVTDGNLMLYVGLAVVVIVLLFLLAVLMLIFCRKRSSKAKEPAVETVYASVPETNQVYEDIRHEDRQSRAPAVEISSVYTEVKYTKPNAVETNDDYNFVTADSSQHKDVDESDKLTYSVVNFSNRTVDEPDSAPHGGDDGVVYSGTCASGRSEL